jgi:hypothetical protein
MNKSLIPYEPSFIEDYSDYVDPENYIIAHRYILTKGWLVVVIRQIYNFKIAISKRSPNFYDDCWCYARFEDQRMNMLHVLYEFALWDPAHEKEPEGWIRNPTTGRRRPEGKKEKEYVSL